MSKTSKTKFTVSSLAHYLVHPSVCPSYNQGKNTFFSFFLTKLWIFKEVILTAQGWNWLLWGYANCQWMTPTAQGWPWLSLGDADWRCKKFRMLCEKFRIQCENVFFLNMMWKTSKNKFTVSSLAHCLLLPYVCPSYIQGKIAFFGFF